MRHQWCVPLLFAAPTIAALCARPAWNNELATARSAAAAAGAVLRERPTDLQAARARLNDALSTEEARQAPGRWVSHVDPVSVSVALLSSSDDLGGVCPDGCLDRCHPAVLGLVSRPAEDEVAYATLDGGAYVQRGDGEAEVLHMGAASDSANVFNLPKIWCPELGTMVEHLTDTGTGMPVEIKRRADGGVCEGLLDVVLGSADVHLAPPARFLPQSYPPPPVLCAFDRLLEEGGGCLTDVYGDPIDLLGAADATLYSESGVGSIQSAVPLRGLMAAHEVMLPYLARAMKAAFPPSEPGAVDLYLDRLRLADRYDGEYSGLMGASANVIDEDGWKLELAPARESRRGLPSRPDSG